MPARSHDSGEQELVCWHPGPCADCRGGLSLEDFLRECDEAAGEVSGDSDNEITDNLIERERKWLIDWIAICPHREAAEHALEKYDEGSEHLVYLPPNSPDVVKLTKVGLYGDSYFLVKDRVHQRSSTPLDYLVRISLLNKYFDFGAEVLGVTAEGQIVTRQPFAAGVPPTDAEVTEFLLLAGVEPVKLNCWLWKKADIASGWEYWVGDARAENFVKTPQGIVPIDVRMWRNRI